MRTLSPLEYGDVHEISRVIYSAKTSPMTYRERAGIAEAVHAHLAENPADPDGVAEVIDAARTSHMSSRGQRVIAEAICGG